MRELFKIPFYLKEILKELVSLNRKLEKLTTKSHYGSDTLRTGCWNDREMK